MWGSWVFFVPFAAVVSDQNVLIVYNVKHWKRSRLLGWLRCSDSLTIRLIVNGIADIFQVNINGGWWRRRRLREFVLFGRFTAIAPAISKSVRAAA